MSFPSRNGDSRFYWFEPVTDLMTFRTVNLWRSEINMELFPFVSTAPPHPPPPPH